MKMKFAPVALPALVAMLALGLLTACGEDSSRTHTIPPAHGLETMEVRAVQSLAEQAWDGVVEAVEDTTISAQTMARVMELPVDVGDRVRRGDVLMRFSDVEQESARRSAEAGVRAARAEYEDARSALERVREIHERGLVSSSQLDAATARYNAGQAMLNAAEAALASADQQADYTRIRAPFDGVITQRHVEIGQAVQSGPPAPQPLISLASLESLRVEVAVPQSAVAAIRDYARAAVLLPDGRRIEAPALTVFPKADPASHSFRVRVLLPAQTADLYPGMTVKVAFAVGDAHRLLVPASALVRRGELHGLYVVDDSQRVQLRMIRPGHRMDGQVEVLAGLEAGVRIALNPEQAAAHLVALHSAR